MPESLKPFVKQGQRLAFSTALEEQGLWPPKLHGHSDDHSDRQTTTPFFIIPTTVLPVDNGSRPQPNSRSFHSQGIWIEDLTGGVAATPVIGARYRIKCRVRNAGAFPAYGGMADFFVNRPEAFAAAAATGAMLPSIGHTGFVLLQGQEAVITCPNLWQPTTAADLALSIVVHAYDPFADNLISRFDARNDRHVGRHDFAPDLYVRDWTDSAAIHDDGMEPSARTDFQRASDVWNRRSAAPGQFVQDQPQNQNPQQGNGPAGDNFIFARISRNTATVEQTAKAHFLFAEFGTGSPFVDCSSDPDPSVVLGAGVTSAIISQRWRLHPSSSSHLCVAVQIYSDADPYMPPGLLGYTPGWPTTDLMVINDNNKAQRNISVWDGLPETEGVYYGIIFNAATFVRDVTLGLDASPETVRKFRNARVGVSGSHAVQEFRPGTTVVLKKMLPGERRWVEFSYDAVNFDGAKPLMVNFHERVGKDVVNGFALGVRAISPEKMVQPTISMQASVFFRMTEGLRVTAAGDGLALCQQLQDTRADLSAYVAALPRLARIIDASLRQMFAEFSVADAFDILPNIRRLAEAGDLQAPAALALHNKILHQTDAMQTMALKSKGDLADILFTVRLQNDVYGLEKLASSQHFDELLKKSSAFIDDYRLRSDPIETYVHFVQSLAPFFERTASIPGHEAVNASYIALRESFARTPQEIQRAHLNFLNAVLVAYSNG